MDFLSHIYGYLFIYAAGLQSVAVAMVLGGLTVHGMVVRPLSGQMGNAGHSLLCRSRFILFLCAMILVVAAGLRLGVQMVVLSAQTGTDTATLLRSIFGRSQLVLIGTALSITLVVLTRLDDRRRGALLPLLFLLVVCAASVGSQGIAAIEGRWLLVALHLVHWTGIGVWLGSVPVFLGTMAVAADGATAHRLASRYMALTLVGLLLAGGGGAGLMALQVGQVEAVLGTTYGALSGLKGVVAAAILFIGLANIVRLVRWGKPSDFNPHRLIRWSEVQFLLAVALLLLSAVQATQPPPILGVGDSPTSAEILARMAPQIPVSLLDFDINRYGLPGEEVISAATAMFAAGETPWQGGLVGGPTISEPTQLLQLWSEASHHLFGALLIIVALFAIFDRTEGIHNGSVWPVMLGLVAIAIILRADLAFWPLGPKGSPIASLAEGRVLEHRLIALMLILAMSGELFARLGLISARVGGSLGGLFMLAATVLVFFKAFPLVGALRLQVQTLFYMPLFCLGLVAGCGRWLEARLDAPYRRAYGWLWTLSVFGAGVLLLFYNEAMG